MLSLNPPDPADYGDPAGGNDWIIVVAVLGGIALWTLIALHLRERRSRLYHEAREIELARRDQEAREEQERVIEAYIKRMDGK